MYVNGTMAISEEYKRVQYPCGTSPLIQWSVEVSQAQLHLLFSPVSYSRFPYHSQPTNSPCWSP